MNIKGLNIKNDAGLPCQGVFQCGECGQLHINQRPASECCAKVHPPQQLDKLQVGGTHHYLKPPVQPWDLMKVMDTSGNAFVDMCRGAVIKYSFRKKSDMLEDLKKARHYLDAAIEVLETK